MPPIGSILLLAMAQSLDAPGPHPVDSTIGADFVLPSATITGDLYWPDGATREVPSVVVSHGFARNAEVMAGWGTHLASHGFLVVVPNLPRPFAPDYELNADVLAELLAHLRAQPPGGLSVDPLRSALIGHSAGGLATFLAAAELPDLTAAVGLDPVDNQNRGVTAGPNIDAPVLVLAAEPARCNAQGSATQLFASLTSAGSWFARIAGSTHCDGEDPSNNTCSTFCGGDDPSRRALYRRLATAHLLASFYCVALEELPGGTELAAAVAAGQVADVTANSALCATDGGADAGTADSSTLDAGAPEKDAQGVDEDASGPDAGEPADAGEAVDAGSPPEDAALLDGEVLATAPPDQGCGCSAMNVAGAPSAWLLWLFLLRLRPSRRARTILG